MVKAKEFSQDWRAVVAKHFEMKKPTVEIIICMPGQVSEWTVYCWVSELKNSVKIWICFLVLVD
jgi:hypothetical protein